MRLSLQFRLLPFTLSALLAVLSVWAAVIWPDWRLFLARAESLARVDGPA